MAQPTSPPGLLPVCTVTLKDAEGNVIKEVGEFIFHNRTRARFFQVRGRQCVLAKEAGDSADSAFMFECEVIASLEILVHAGPPGWSLQHYDLREKDSWAEIGAIYGALRAREDEFLAQQKAARTGVGAGELSVGRVLVP